MSKNTDIHELASQLYNQTSNFSSRFDALDASVMATIGFFRDGHASNTAKTDPAEAIERFNRWADSILLDRLNDARTFRAKGVRP